MLWFAFMDGLLGGINVFIRGGILVEKLKYRPVYRHLGSGEGGQRL